MASCYDCIHCDACSNIGDSGFSYLKEDVSKCKHFKNKADVKEVKHGEWIDVPYRYFGTKRYMCNQCSDDEYWKMRFHTVKEKFCPNCGAEMNGGKRE